MKVIRFENDEAFCTYTMRPREATDTVQLDNYIAIPFVEPELQGYVELPKPTFLEKFRQIGLANSQLEELLPNIDWTNDQETLAIHSKKLIYGLRRLGVYEDDLVGAFYDLVIQALKREMIALREARIRNENGG